MEKIPSGIDGLDDLLNGGFPKNRTILLLGATGTGKSTFGVQFLVNGALKYKQPGILITLEEAYEDMCENYYSYGWDLKDLFEKNLLRVYTPPPALQMEETEHDLFLLVDVIQRMAEEINAKRIVFDSLSSFSVTFTNFQHRKRLLALSHLLNELDCTSLILAETTEDKIASSNYGEEAYISQGIIVLHYERLASSRHRGIEIRKMRGVSHSQKIKEMEITEKGIKVFSQDYIR
jgi:KaiC/GvpD/RAD55 family RecA-like ATPase